MKILQDMARPLAFYTGICYTVCMKDERNHLNSSDAPEVIAPELPAPPETPVRSIRQNDRPSRPGTRYRFRFTALTLAVLLAGLALCLAAIGLTTWQFADFLRAGSLGNALEWLKFALLYGVSGALAILIVAMFVRSEYVLTDRELTLVFGFVRSKSPLSTISSVHLFKGANRLVVYFEDAKTRYMAIVIKDTLYETFAKDLISRSEHIAFSFSTAEEEEEIKKKKK